jgi:hypothetical protein
MISNAAALMAPDCTGALPGDHDSLRLPVLKIHVGEVLTLAMNCGTSRAPIPPLVPATKIRIMCSFSVFGHARRYEKVTRQASPEVDISGGILDIGRQRESASPFGKHVALPG